MKGNMVSKHMVLGRLNLGCMWGICVALIDALFKRGWGGGGGEETETEEIDTTVKD